MLTLKELRFRNIGCFVEEQTINFEVLGNLVQVDGKNNNTGGSSGAAKSTIFCALDFLFGINSIPNLILQSRRTAEPMWVEGVFDYDGVPLTITRGKKLKIEFNGEVTTGSSKISEEKLDQILAIPRHLFKPMLHKEQGERGFFLNFTPKETNDFLTDCFGFSHLKASSVKLDLKLQELNKQVEQLTANVNVADAGWTAAKSAMDALGPPPVKEIDQDTILALKAKSEASSAILQSTLEDHQDDLSRLESSRPVFVTVPYDRSKKIAYEQELQNLRTQINNLLLAQKDKENEAKEQIRQLKTKKESLDNLVKKGLDAKEEIAREAAKVKKIRESICPQCEQTWTTETASKEMNRLLVNISKLREIMVNGELAYIELGTAQAALDDAMSNSLPPIPEGSQALLEKDSELKGAIAEENKREYIHNDAQNSLSASKQQVFQTTVWNLRTEQNKEQEKIRGQADLDRRIFETAVMKFRSYEQLRIGHEKGLETLKKQEIDYSNKFSELYRQLLDLKSYVESMEELKRAVKSYLSCSFDEALEVISENATRLVRNVPNMANATVQLSGTWETKEGKVKEEVTAVINLDGDENVDIRSLCGGERSAIDLAVDLSAIELIENKTNKGINIFVLDEPFTGLDTVCIEMALDVLKNSNTNKKLIIVDHNPEVKQMVESRLLVVRDGLTSKVIQN